MKHYSTSYLSSKLRIRATEEPDSDTENAFSKFILTDLVNRGKNIIIYLESRRNPRRLLRVFKHYVLQLSAESWEISKIEGSALMPDNIRVAPIKIYVCAATITFLCHWGKPAADSDRNSTLESTSHCYY